MTVSTNAVAEQFGNIDIYEFDELLRGRIAPGMRVLDAGCGGGRSIVYLLRSGYDVYGVAQDPRAIDAVRRPDGELAPQLPRDKFRVESVEATTFQESSA